MGSVAEARWPERSEESPRTGIPSPVFGILVFIVTEIMFFAALVSAYLVTTANAVQWPPEGQPRLPLVVTGINTAILIASGILIHLAGREFDRSLNAKKAKTYFFRGLVLGGLFLLIQGFEWLQLLSYGFTLQSSIMGSFFYVVIGSHAIHVIGAVIGLTLLYRKLGKGRMTLDGFSAARIFWYFVVGVWPVLYGLVYLA